MFNSRLIVIVPNWLWDSVISSLAIILPDGSSKLYVPPSIGWFVSLSLASTYTGIATSSGTFLFFIVTIISLPTISISSDEPSNVYVPSFSPSVAVKVNV